MKKGIKVILVIVGLIFGIIILDSIQALVFNNNPLIGIETKCQKRKGIFVDTYHCGEKNITRIKKFSSSCNNESVCNSDSIINNDFTIIDQSKEIKDFVCDMALEPFYEDEKYTYSYNCIKSDYVIVKYNDNSTETVKEALNKQKITITDLDKFGIAYYKEEKSSIQNTNEVINSVKIIINGKDYLLNLEKNETARSFISLLPQEFNMKELNGNEKYIYLDTKLPTNSFNPKRINTGDVMLYGDNCLVIFYKSFDTTYSYTKIGHIDSLPDLGNNNVLVKIEK